MIFNKKQRENLIEALIVIVALNTINTIHKREIEMRKYYEKNPPKKTGKTCKNDKCNKPLTTADTLYSDEVGFCFNCSKINPKKP